MKHFYKHASSFLILLIISASIFDLCISVRLKNSPDEKYRTWKEINSDTTQFKTVIFGSSEVRRDCNPTIISDYLKQSTFNCAQAGMNFDKFYGIYYYYLQYKKAPELLVINISVYTLRKSSNKTYQVEQYFPQLYDSKFRSTVCPTLSLNWAQKNIPLFRYFGYSRTIKEGLGLNSISNTHPLKNGYAPNKNIFVDSYYSDIKEINFDASPDVISKFNKLLKRAHEDGSKIIFFYTPLYSRIYTKIRNIDDMYRTFDSIAKPYNIEILDFSHTEMSKDKTYFFDDFHLNSKGADYFSQKLADRLKKM